MSKKKKKNNKNKKKQQNVNKAKNNQVQAVETKKEELQKEQAPKEEAKKEEIKKEEPKAEKKKEQKPKKEKVQKEKPKKEEKTKKEKKSNVEDLEIVKRLKDKHRRKQVFTVAVIVFILSIVYLICYFYSMGQDKDKIKQVQDYKPEVSVVEEKSKEITPTMLKVAELKKENEDVKAWIKIDDTIVDYPVLQGDDNEYYLKHDYKKEYNKYGSIYIKPGCDINNANSNLVIYGHNMKDDEMFNTLLNYQKPEYYADHKIVKITTPEEEREYEVVSAFRSRVFYQEEKDVFRYYNQLNFADEKEYNSYMDNVRKIQLYDTGIKANYGEQLITLITCEYSQENGRMVVVAKRVK